MYGILVSYSNTDFRHEIEYVFRTVFSTIGTPFEIIDHHEFDERKDETRCLLWYGKELDERRQNVIWIKEGDFFGPHYLKKESLSLNLSCIPYLLEHTEKRFIHKSEKRIEIHADLIASIFFFLTRYEELLVESRDHRGRFSAQDSFAFQQNILEIPSVDLSMNIIKEEIEALFPNLKTQEKWNGKSFTVVLTHDIDLFSPPLSYRLKNILNHAARCDIKNVIAHISSLMKSHKNTLPSGLEYLLQYEKEHHLPSSYYFIAEKTHALDGNYSIEESLVKRYIETLTQEKKEIGVHPGIETWKSANMIVHAKKRLESATGKEIAGSRQHYLRLSVSETFRALEKAGMRYDTTLGFHDAIGFRAGTCFPFRPFDVEKRREMNLWELPLLLMDVTLLNYMRLRKEDAAKRIYNLIDRVKQVGGVFVTLWHGLTFEMDNNHETRSLYESMIAYAKENGAWFTTAGEVVEVWKKRMSNMGENNEK